MVLESDGEIVGVNVGSVGETLGFQVSGYLQLVPMLDLVYIWEPVLEF